MATHDLKTHPEPFHGLLIGSKTYEVRHGLDREFHVGDALILREWEPPFCDLAAKEGAPILGEGRYTGRHVVRFVSHITAGPAWGLPHHLFVLGLDKVHPEERAAARDAEWEHAIRNALDTYRPGLAEVWRNVPTGPEWVGEWLAEMMGSEWGPLFLIGEERARQIQVHGYSPERDDAYTDGELARAAQAYAQAAVYVSTGTPLVDAYGEPPKPPRFVWPGPWAPGTFRPSSDPLRNLAKAGALLLAEMERLARSGVTALEPTHLAHGVSKALALRDEMVAEGGGVDMAFSATARVRDEGARACPFHRLEPLPCRLCSILEEAGSLERGVLEEGGAAPRQPVPGIYGEGAP